MEKRITAALLLLLLASALVAREQTIVLGQEDQWQPVSSIDRLIVREGRAGYLDLELLPFRHEADASTELLLQFDSFPLSDQVGNHFVMAQMPELSTTTVRSGLASLLLDSPDDVVTIFPGAGSLFQPGVEWGSFSLEFWLYPVTLRDGDEVIHWQAREGRSGEFREQSIAVTVERRRLRFSFANFFVPPDESSYSVDLSAIDGLIPRKWSHHLVRFDSKTGLFEYLVDAIPQEITHITESGREDGSVFFPRIAQFANGGIELGRRFTGAIDELRVSRRFVEDPTLQRFWQDGGSFESQILDLGSPGAIVSGISAEATTPGMTDVFLYYRTSNRRDSATALPGEWVPVLPDSEFPPAMGRFVQIRAELFPDARITQSPSLSTVRIAYRPDPPPLPPTTLRAVPGDGTVALQWAPAQDPDIDGYLVYYGEQPGRYFGIDSELGESPIDVGLATTVILTGLKNGSLYYFAVSAYDASGVGNTALSTEVAARPAKAYR